MAKRVIEAGPKWNILQIPGGLCLDDLQVLNERWQPSPERKGESLDPVLQDSLTLELWRSVANIRLWAENRSIYPDTGLSRTTLVERRNRRRRAGIVAPELIPAFEIIGCILESPHHVNRQSVITSCLRIAQWAEQRGMTETAMQFTEAAAAVAPGSPTLANLAGKACRNHNRVLRAELWYDRAIGLSRRKLDVRSGRREYIHAHLGLGTLFLERDDVPNALAMIWRAARAARRAGMKAKAAEAFHDLLGISTLSGNLGRATVFARRAIAMYPQHHARFPALAYDFSLLLVALGLYSAALTVLQSVIQKIHAPAEQLVVWGTLGWAAAGAGHVAAFDAAVAQVSHGSSTFRTGAAALYGIAEGARLLGKWEHAETFARSALDQARTIGLTQIETRAVRLLTEIRDGAEVVPEMANDDARGSVLRTLVPSVKVTLEKWRGPTWRPKLKRTETDVFEPVDSVS